jgi:FkbM family methyltransferase
VISLEPDPTNADACRRNLEAHVLHGGVDNVTLCQAAAGTGATLRFSAEGSMGSSAVSYVGGYRGRVIEVDSLSLQQIVHNHELERVDFIKIDIEGAELDLLRDSRAVLAEFRPRLMIEAHVVGGRLDADELVQCLASYGYTCSVIEQHGVALPLVTAYCP